MGVPPLPVRQDADGWVQIGPCGPVFVLWRRDGRPAASGLTARPAPGHARAPPPRGSGRRSWKEVSACGWLEDNTGSGEDQGGAARPGVSLRTEAQRRRGAALRVRNTSLPTRSKVVGESVLLASALFPPS